MINSQTNISSFSLLKTHGTETSLPIFGHRSWLIKIHMIEIFSLCKRKEKGNKLENPLPYDEPEEILSLMVEPAYAS
jgi:hypothetical protein